jgi:hypothetical protein
MGEKAHRFDVLQGEFKVPVRVLCEPIFEPLPFLRHFHGTGSIGVQPVLERLEFLIGIFVEGVDLLKLLLGHEADQAAEIGDRIALARRFDRRQAVFLVVSCQLGEEACREPVPRPFRPGPSGYPIGRA